MAPSVYCLAHTRGNQEGDVGPNTVLDIGAALITQLGISFWEVALGTCHLACSLAFDNNFDVATSSSYDRTEGGACMMRCAIIRVLCTMKLGSSLSMIRKGAMISLMTANHPPVTKLYCFS